MRALVPRRGLLFGLLALVACARPGPAPPPPTASPAPGGVEPLRIGGTVSLTGRFSREGQLLRAGYETWRQAANEQGGVQAGARRRPVELLLRDDESEPLTAIGLIDGLVRRDGIGLLVGSISSQIALASATAAERLGALSVVPDASSPGVYARGLQLVVSILPTEDRFFDGIAELAATAAPRARPIGLLISDDPFFNAAADGLRERAQSLGIEDVAIERYAADERDVARQIGRLAQARPRCLIVAGEQDRMAAFVPALRELELVPPMRALVPLPVRGAASAPGALDPALEGTLTADWWSPDLAVSGPILGSAREFAERFRALHGYVPDNYAAAAAAAGLALQLGIERAGSVDPKLVRAAIGRLDVRTFRGRLAWDQTGRSQGPVPVFQVQDGRLAVVQPRGYGERPLRYPA